MPERPELSSADRAVAGILAAVWIAAGFAGLVIGLWLRPALLPVLLSPFALGYGWLWLRVTRTGRRQHWPAWNRRRH
jgi:hypothetical protein